MSVKEETHTDLQYWKNTIAPILDLVLVQERDWEESSGNYLCGGEVGERERKHCQTNLLTSPGQKKEEDQRLPWLESW